MSSHTFPSLEDHRHDEALWSHACRSAERASRLAQERRAERAALPLAGAQPEEASGLVPSKTTPNDALNTSVRAAVLSVNLSKFDQMERRIKRMRSKVWLSGYLHNMPRKGHRAAVPWFVTLTYADPRGWRADHVSRSLDAFRRWCRRRGVLCRFTWVAEIQPKRLEATGLPVVHYHLICWLPPGVRMPKWDKPTTSCGRTVAPFWCHGMTNTQRAKTGIAYLMKYVSKMGGFHEFPKGARMHGHGGYDGDSRVIASWYSLPEWVKCSFGVGDVARIGGRLVDLSTGELVPPLYSRKFEGGFLHLTPLREPPERWHEGAYCSLDFGRD